mgnify:CR=1 FL=1
MKDIIILDEDIKPYKDVVSLGEKFDITKHINDHIYMFGGNVINSKIELLDKNAITYVIDWFGNNARIYKDNDKLYANIKSNDNALKVDATDNVASVDTKNNNDSISVAEIENDENNNQSDSKLKSEVIDQSSSADENDVLGAAAERDLLGRSLDDLKSDINRNSGLTQDYSGGNVNGKITFGSKTIYSAKSDGSKIVMDFDGYSYITSIFGPDTSGRTITFENIILKNFNA